MGYDVAVRELQSVERIAVSGELSIQTWTPIWNRVQQALNGAFRHISIDIDAIDYLDGIGLTLLASAWQVVRSRGGKLTVVCSDPRRRRILQKVGLDRYICIVPADPALLQVACF